ncbi:hypothetical protein [Thiocapsa marina]|nr:hypothetical protein [Thiocapsa marina]
MTDNDLDDALLDDDILGDDDDRLLLLDDLLRVGMPHPDLRLGDRWRE